eukprot:Seg3025.7 transcript_id=Seg3025.7/GoldUCD/mRNA.D3Y31 product="hypothetical protein" protein_id=Seg3025.7/GoldUCD/D3Y31
MASSREESFEGVMEKLTKKLEKLTINHQPQPSHSSSQRYHPYLRRSPTLFNITAHSGANVFTSTPENPMHATIHTDGTIVITHSKTESNIVGKKEDLIPNSTVRKLDPST